MGAVLLNPSLVSSVHSKSGINKKRGTGIEGPLPREQEV